MTRTLLACHVALRGFNSAASTQRRNMMSSDRETVRPSISWVGGFRARYTRGMSPRVRRSCATPYVSAEDTEELPKTRRPVLSCVTYPSPLKYPDRKPLRILESVARRITSGTRFVALDSPHNRRKRVASEAP